MGKLEYGEQAVGKAHRSPCPSASPHNQTKAAKLETQIYPPLERQYCLQPSICYTKDQVRDLWVFSWFYADKQK